MSSEDQPVTTASILEMMQAMVGQMRDSVNSNVNDINLTITNNILDLNTQISIYCHDVGYSSGF